ncbi:MAG: diacylglycerol kinase family lipid kinase [Anaerolineaceae bacterium]|nr:diacylglycerol kinase family lipid kinase [Anaerolineaceae bacterium]
MPRKVKLIFNPIANLGRAWPVAAALRPIVYELGGADWTGTVYPTHATELARQAGEDGYDLVVAMGGDGTVHEVVNGLMQLPPERRPSLGVVPVGSGNDFAFALGISSKPEQALRQVLTGDLHPIDIGRVCDNFGRNEYWTNTIGIGFDTIVTIYSRKVPLFQGFAVYFLAVLQTILFNHEPFRLELKVDGQRSSREVIMLVLCNGKREGGGFLIDPQASVQDGSFSYLAIDTVSRLRMLATIPYFLNGTHHKLAYVHAAPFRQLELSSTRSLYIHTDGEVFAGFGSRVNHLTVETLPGAINAVF